MFSELHGKRILVTGATGLIGSHLCAAIQTGEHLTAPSFDLCDMSNVAQLGMFDIIIHAAGYGQPGKFMADPVKTLKINTATTLALFEHLNEGGKFLFISSSEVYSGLQPPYREKHIGTTTPLHPRACYIEAKRCGEAICNAYRGRGINAISARVALAYGPGTKPHDQRIINVLIERGLSGCITLQDMGTAVRNYCYISDTVEILWKILLEGTQPVYNVGGQSRTTIAELALQIGRYLGVPVVFPVASHELKGAPEEVCLDMSLITKEFNKTQYVSLEEGLAKTIEWQKQLYGGKNALHRTSYSVRKAVAEGHEQYP